MPCETLMLSAQQKCALDGGGFAGTVQAFVPVEKLDIFRAGIDAVLGTGACHVLHICPQGGVEVMLSGGKTDEA